MSLEVLLMHAGIMDKPSNYGIIISSSDVKKSRLDTLPQNWPEMLAGSVCGSDID